jgi:hypothetical protein
MSVSNLFVFPRMVRLFLLLSRLPFVKESVNGKKLSNGSKIV